MRWEIPAKAFLPPPHPPGTGFLFLLAYGGWGLYCLPLAGRPQGSQAAKALWGAVSALALLVSLLQLWFQVRAVLLRVELFVRVPPCKTIVAGVFG